MAVSNSTLITFEQARKIAEDAALRDVRSYLAAEQVQVLEDEWLEAEGCWFFFRNKKIIVPPENWFIRLHSCYAVSKKGTVSQLEDFSSDPERLRAYLQAVSDYFIRRGE